MKVIRYLIVSIMLTYSSLSSAADALKVTPPQQKILSNPNGRYVFGQISEFHSDQYMIDTQTGRLWIIEYRKSDIPGIPPENIAAFPVLTSVPYSGTDGGLNLWPK